MYNDYHGAGLEDTVRHNKGRLAPDGANTHSHVMAEEHADVKKKIFKAEHAFVNSDSYDGVLADAVEAFLAHAVEEETAQFPQLLEMWTPEQNDVGARARLHTRLSPTTLSPPQQIARAFLKARESVPRRPHPLTPQTGGMLQKAMGMHGKVQDKVGVLCHEQGRPLTGVADCRGRPGQRVCRPEVQAPRALRLSSGDARARTKHVVL